MIHTDKLEAQQFLHVDFSRDTSRVEHKTILSFWLQMETENGSLFSLVSKQ
jgi:hypothetical protein